jgi:hypothetical protein
LLFIKNKIAQNTAIILVGLFMVSDLFFVDKNYVSAQDFVRERGRSSFPANTFRY